MYSSCLFEQEPSSASGSVNQSVQVPLSEIQARSLALPLNTAVHHSFFDYVIDLLENTSRVILKFLGYIHCIMAMLKVKLKRYTEVIPYYSLDE